MGFVDLPRGGGVAVCKIELLFGLGDTRVSLTLGVNVTVLHQDLSRCALYFGGF